MSSHRGLSRSASPRPKSHRVHSRDDSEHEYSSRKEKRHKKKSHKRQRSDADSEAFSPKDFKCAYKFNYISRSKLILYV
jgi:hypothetical protein